MKLFFDSSALIKRYISELGSPKVDELFNSCSQVIVSPITKIEVHSTAKRLAIEKFISKNTHQQLIKEIEIDFSYFSVLPFNSSIESKAISLINKYQLKTLDSIQLASFLYFEDKVDSFVVSDKKLIKAAISENVDQIDPTDFG